MHWAFLRFITAGCTLWRVLAADALDSWSLRYSGREQIDFITFSSGSFVACGKRGTILTSEDAMEWRSHAAPREVDLKAVASDGAGRYIALGAEAQSGNTLFLRSSDGTETNWLRQDVLFFDEGGREIPMANIRDPLTLAFVPGEPAAFYAGFSAMSAGGQPVNPIYFSHDTTNWHAPQFLRRLDPIGAPWMPQYISTIFSGQLRSDGPRHVIAAGSILTAISRGTLGNGFSNFYETQFPSEYVMAGAAGNGLFMLIGLEGAALVSTNGQDWQARLTPAEGGMNPGSDYYNLNYMVGNGLAFGNGTFVVCTTYPNHILSSTNGIWTKHPIPFYGLKSIAYGNGRFVAVGNTNIVASENIATPGLSIANSSKTNLTLTLSGEIGRGYQLEASNDLTVWTAIQRFTNSLPVEQRAVSNDGRAVFYRAVRQ